jgi:sugar phosphate isomerase/epimerase
MIFAYSTNAFVKHSLLESVSAIADLGFGGVEILADRPHLYPPDYSEDQMLDLRAALDRAGLKVTNLNSFTLFAVGDTYLPSWIEPEAERRDVRIQHTLDCLRAAATLKCPNISVPPGGPLNGVDAKTAMAEFHRGLERVTPLAEELGISILIEPEPGLMIENARQFKTMIRDVRSRAIGINFDIGHFFCANEDPTAAFESLFEWVGHVHLEDIPASRVHQHLIPGQGELDFEGIFRQMVRLGYSGDISLELYPYVDMPVEAGRRSMDYLRPIFEKTGLPISHP